MFKIAQIDTSRSEHGRSLVAIVLLTGCGAKPPAPIDAPGHASPAVDAKPPPVVGVDAPVAARPTPRATAVVAGVSHTCALLDDASVACWGRAAGGTLGEDVPEAEQRRTRPRRVAGVTARGLAAGFRSTCALGQDATACWGENLQFLGGSGLVVGGTSTPKPFPGLAGARALGLSGQLSCAVVADAALACWGEGLPAQPRTADNLVRFPIAGGAVDVASAGGHTCAVATDGRVHCLGANASGQLGVGDTRARAAPTEVARLRSATQVATAGTLTCAVHAEGLSCWGGFRCPPAGDCGVQDVARTRPQALTGLGRVRAVVLRQLDALALRTDGTVAQTDVVASFHSGRTTVTPLAGLQDVTALAAGNDHVCALVADGRLLCWGANSSGELGDGTLVSRETPAEVDLQALAAP